MQQNIIVEQQILGQAEAIWKTISQGGDVHKWFPTIIQSCRLEKANGKLSRFCTMYDGSQLEENIVEVNDEARVFVYTVDQHPLPASEIITTIEVKDLGNDSTSVVWGSQFVADRENIPLVEETLRGIYMQGIKSLESWQQKSSS